MSDEKARLKKLEDYQILDTLPEQVFDDLTRIASVICGTPMALVSLVDDKRQWFKSKIGVDASETTRDIAFCAHAIEEREVMVVENAQTDPRFKDNPLVTGDLSVRFYAGAPLWTDDGHCLGTLCVIDRRPRELTDVQKETLQALGRQVMGQLELRRRLANEEKERIKSELQETELREILRLIPVGLVKTTNQGAGTYFNQMWSQITGRDAEESMGQKWLMMVHPEDRERLLAQQLIARQTNSSLDAKVRIVRPSGEIRWIKLHSQPEVTLKSDNAPRGRIGSVLDITDITRREAEVIASEMRYRSLVDAATDAIIGADQDGMIISWSNGASKMFGFTAAEMIGQPIVKIMPDRSRSDFEAMMRLEHQAGVAHLLGQTESIFGIGNDGREFPIEISLSSWKQGDALNFTAIARDITERSEMARVQKEFNEALAAKVTERTEQLEVLNTVLDQRNQHLRTIMTATPIIIWALNKDGFCTLAEGKILAELGLNAHELVGLHFEEIGRKVPKLAENSRRTLNGESIVSRTELYDRTFETIYTPLRDDRGVIVGTVAVSTDISSTLEAERLSMSEKSAHEASRLKSEFLANMSHEIRTPLNAIIGMSSLALGTQLNDEQHEYVETINRSADGLRNIISDILDFSKVEAGQVNIEMTPFDLGQMMNGLQFTFGLAANRKGITYSTESHLRDGQLVTGDSGRIQQVLNNLIGNAIKFTGFGNVKTKIIEIIRGGGISTYRFEVSDTGIGIAKDALEAILRPFTQVDNSTTRRFGGTGLGLSICDQLVKLMQGRIGVASELGQGSVFWFELDLATQSKTDAWTALQNQQLDLGGDVTVLRSRSVLLVEDNVINQRMVLRMLSKVGMKVHAVVNGIEALDALTTMTFDLILMDCQMSEMDGYEATRRIRAQKSETLGRVPIIALTANAIMGDRERCLEAGMNDYLAKPIQDFELLRMLLKWIKPVSLIDETPAPLVMRSNGFGAPVLNRAALDQLLDPDAEKPDAFLFEIVEMFRELAPRTLTELTTAFESRQITTVKEKAHFLKSSCNIVGLLRMRNTCQQLEDETDPPDLAKIEALINQLHSEFRAGFDLLLAEVYPANRAV